MSTFKKLLVGAYCYRILNARIVTFLFKRIKALKSA